MGVFVYRKRTGRFWVKGRLRLLLYRRSRPDSDRQDVFEGFGHLLSLEETVTEFKRYVAIDSASEPRSFLIACCPLKNDLYNRSLIMNHKHGP